MTPQELKNSILQLAIQGKLVEQRPEEGTAEELYQQIQAEKQALIKAGKIKKEKPLPEIAEDEKPFDIPESWKWVRLSEIALITGGFAFKSTAYTEEGVRVVRISDFNENGFVNTKIVRHPYDSTLEPFLLEEKNILLCMTGGTVGKSLFVKSLPERMMTNQRVATIKICGAVPEYINSVILAPITQKVIQDSKNSTNDNISMDTIKGFFVPLPPIAEQKRIVAKIEELLPLIDHYEEAWTKLEEFNKHFPGDMQKSLLQMAIQGKLVEQRHEEGNGEELYAQIQAEKQALIKAGEIKKDKPLPEITDDDKPFDIPESWKWVRLGEILASTDAGKSPQCEDRSRSDNEWGVIKTTAIQNGFFLPEENKVLPEQFVVQDSQIVHSGDLLITRAGPRNRTGVLCVVSKEPTNLILSDKTVRLSYIKGLVEPLFVMYMLNSPAGQVSITEAMTGMAASQVNISQDSMKKFLLPLPPLAEQKRIVAKLEQLLPLCERLK